MSPRTLSSSRHGHSLTTTKGYLGNVGLTGCGAHCRCRRLTPATPVRRYALGGRTMLIAPFTTVGSRLAAGSSVLLLLALPIVDGLVEKQNVRSALFCLAAILIGGSLGWVAGDALRHSSPVGQIITAAALLLLVVAGLLLPIWNALKAPDEWSAALLHDMFMQPWLNPAFTGATRYALVAFALTSVVASLSSDGVPAPDPRTPQPEDEEYKKSLAGRYDRMRAVGAVISAGGAGIGAVTLVIGVWQLGVAEDRWRKEVTIRAIAGESVDQPFISRHCLGALNALGDAQINSVLVREETNLDPKQFEYVGRCFADHEDVEGKYLQKDKHILTRKGAALLAQRVNYTITKDGWIANLLRTKIADKDLVRGEIGERICRYDKLLVPRLSKIEVPGYPGKYVIGKEDPLLWLVQLPGFCP